jgi:hypothetical protein
MTTQFAVVDGLPTGLTVTAKLFASASPDTLVTGNTFAFAEGANALGRYVVTITRATLLPAGDYTLRLFVGAAPIAVMDLVFAGTANETATEAGVELDSAARVKLDAVQPDYAPLLASGYTAPANSDITAIKAKTDNLPSDPADQSLIIVATDAVMARLGAPAGLSMSADLAAVKLETGTTLPAQIAALNNLSSAQVVSALGSGTWATALPWNAAWDSEVQSEVQDAIEVNNLDHLLKIAVDTNFATTVHLDSVIGNIADNGTAATFVRTTDSLEAIRDNQSSGGGGGDATLAKQTEILAAVAGVTSSVASHAARLALEVQIQGFPAVICRNSDYATETESEIRLTLLDLTGTAITEIAGTPVASLAWLFGMGTEAAPAIIAGAVTWDAGTSELVIQFARSVTAAKPLGSITWQIGVSTGSGATLKNRWLGGGTTRLIERQF